MAQLQPEDIPLFDYSPRIGRLRYLIYSVAILALFMVPGLLLSKLLYAENAGWMARVTLAASLLLPPIAVALLTVPRLHDMGRGGGWAFMSLAINVWLLIWADGGRSPISPSICLPALTTMVSFSPFALLPGGRGHNRFGPSPAPDTRSIRVAAWIAAALCLGWASIPVSAYLYRQHRNQRRVDDAVAKATGAESEWRAYFRAHGAWPDPLKDVIADVAKRHLQYWRSRDGTAFVIDASVYIDDGVLRSYPGGVDLTGVVVWSADGGESWHCGPYGISLSALPESCRELGIPAYTGPI